MRDVIRVVVVDDQPDVRFLVTRVLGGHPGFAVAGEAATPEQAIEVATRERPDVVLLDLMLPDRAEQGIATVRPILQVSPRSMIVAFTAVPAEEAEIELRRLGAFAYYHKESVSNGLASRIASDFALFRQALEGEDVIAPSALFRHVTGS